MLSAKLVIWPNANLEALSALVNVPGFRELSQRIDVSHKRTPAVWVCRQKLDRASRRVRVCKGTKYGQFSTENLEGTERNLRLWGGYADQDDASTSPSDLDGVSDRRGRSGTFKHYIRRICF